MHHRQKRPSRLPAKPPGLPRRSRTHPTSQEKGVDVAIAVDLMRLAFRRPYDALVLFSSDIDLLPALETIAALRLTHVEVACWAGFKPLRFRLATRRDPGVIP